MVNTLKMMTLGRWVFSKQYARKKHDATHINSVTCYTYTFHEHSHNSHFSWAHFTLYLYRLAQAGPELKFFFCIIFFYLFTISPSKNYLESLLPGLHFSSIFSPSLSLFFLIAISTTFCLSSQCCEEPSCVDLVLPDYQHPLPKLPNFLHQFPHTTLCHVSDNQIL